MSDDRGRLDRLERVYGAHTREDLGAGYAAWAGSYDADVLAMGYQSPVLVAAATARHVPVGGPILDVGCGTGLLGTMLAPLGYDDITGLDMSDAMLDLARARGLYRTCVAGLLSEPLSLPAASFAAAVAAGVFTVGHAPAAAIADLVSLVRPGGLLVLGLRWDGGYGAAYESVCEALVHDGRIAPVARTAPFPAFLLSPEEAHVRNVVRVDRVLAPS